MRGRVLTALALGVLATLVFAGCSGGDKPADATTPVDAAATTSEPGKAGANAAAPPQATLRPGAGDAANRAGSALKGR